MRSTSTRRSFRRPAASPSTPSSCPAARSRSCASASTRRGDLVANAGPRLLAVAALEPFHEPHPDLLHHAYGWDVLRARVRADDVRIEGRERVVDECLHRFGGVPATLEPRVDRVADLDHPRLVVRGTQADVADDAAVPRHDGELHPPAGVPRFAVLHLLDLREPRPGPCGPIPASRAPRG